MGRGGIGQPVRSERGEGSVSLLVTIDRSVSSIQAIPLTSFPTPAALVGLLLACIPLDLHAQQRDTVARSDSVRVQPLEAVQVSVARDDARSPFELPFALTSAPLNARPGVRRVGIGDLLVGVPGVQVQDRANPSQDPRIAVRGFGARSAFGVRGVRLLRDGVPLSLPDGQTPVDWLDLETVGQMDVVRGTAAALYGNAAGGVIELRSREAVRAPFGVEARAWDGGGLRRATVILSGRADGNADGNAEGNADARDGGRGNGRGNGRDAQWLGAFTRTSGDGARRWSRLDATSAFVRGLVTIKGTTVELQGTRYEAPRAENTGALTATELGLDPRLPDSLNITKRSRKAASQTQLAFIANRPLNLGGGRGSLRGTLHTGTRTLDNPLPFAIVAVDRAIVGGSLHGTWRTDATAWPLRLGAGFDAQRQMDDRYNYENCADRAPTAPSTTKCPATTERGAVRLEQQERVGGAGSYARIEVEVPHALFLSAALRVDGVSFRVHDRFITATNADDSGERTLRALSPMVGVTWRLRPQWSVHANLTSAFETPTITELTNQADGAAGLNRTLEPQRTRTVEVGTQAVVAGRLRLDLALFHAMVRDELVSFDVPNQPGRRAFRNAGRTSRRGVESGLRYASEHFDLGAAYTWSGFRFDRYDVGPVSYAGKPIPGVPAHTWQSFATVRMAGAWSLLELTAASRASATDAATVYAAGFAVWSLRAGYDWSLMPRDARGRLRLSPAIGIENLFDRHYAGSLVVNATRGRYFEPGLPRRVSVTLQIGWE